MGKTSVWCARIVIPFKLLCTIKSGGALPSGNIYVVVGTYNLLLILDASNGAWHAPSKGPYIAAFNHVESFTVVRG